MISILFICHGNICRSPMAEMIMKELVRRERRDGAFLIASAATSTEEIGNPIYPPAQRTLAAHGIPFESRKARQMTARDYFAFDYLIAMDSYNLENMARFIGGDPEKKVSRLLDWTDHPRDVADPWCTGDYETAWRDIEEGCRCLFQKLIASPT